MHLGYGTDEESGTEVSFHECETCFRPFTLCPPVIPDARGWENCLDWDCPSYVVERDGDLHFITGNVVQASPP